MDQKWSLPDGNDWYFASFRHETDSTSLKCYSRQSPRVCWRHGNRTACCWWGTGCWWRWRCGFQPVKYKHPHTRLCHRLPLSEPGCEEANGEKLQEYDLTIWCCRFGLDCFISLAHARVGAHMSTSDLYVSAPSYLHRVKVTWILVHQVRPPEFNIHHFEYSRWLIGGGDTVTFFVHQSHLQSGRCCTLDWHFVPDKP